jgi:hypothetical protein
MASYPKALQFVTQKINGFSKNVVRVVPGTLTTADPGDVSIWTLPENSLVRLDSLAICGAIAGIRGGGASDKTILTRNIHSYLDMVSIEVNGTTIDGSCMNVNHLYDFMEDFTGGARVTAQSPLALTLDSSSSGATTLANIGRNTTAAVQVGHATAPASVNSDLASLPGSTMTAWPFAITDWLGFLGCGKVIDTSILGTVRLLIRWAPKTLAMGTTASTYRLYDLKMYSEILDVSDGIYYNSIAQRLQTAPITIPFKRFLSFTGSQVTGSTSVRFSASTQSLDAVYGCLINSPTDTTLQTTGIPAETVTWGTQPYFRRYSTNVVSHQLDANSQLYPSFPCNTSDCYYLLRNTFGLTSDKSLGAHPNLNAATWANEMSLFSFRFSYDRSLEYLSGLDARGLSLQLAWNIVASGSTGAFPLVFAETTAYLNVGAYRSISVVS